MRATTRLGLLAAGTGTALVLAGNALAYAPRLVVSTSGQPGADTPVTMTLTQAAGDPATARVRISTPASYLATIPSTPGATIGSATAGGTSGRIVVDDPAAHAGDPCLPGVHAAVWLVEPLGVALYVDGGRDGSPLTIEFCFPHDVQPASLALAFDPGIWKNPASRGEFVWSARMTPSAATGPDTASEVESRAVVRQPTLLSLSGRLARRGRIELYGRLQAGGKKLMHVAVRLMARKTAAKTRIVSSTRTDAAGRYVFSFRLRRTTYFRTRVDLPAADVTKAGCAAPSDAPGGCATATLQPFRALSATFLKVTVRG